MPIYEYICESCGKKVSLLVFASGGEEKKCPKCGGTELRRIMSRFAAPLSEEDRLERLADPSAWSGLDENDPASVARFVKKMGSALGEDLGEDIDELADEAAREAEQAKKGEGEEEPQEL
ncbi:MAG: zinc ribbon domain-containing protein [candidate division KSB1 bacterium]|nr:zinc ribbon domain-containing protein [candidate division KSB1 bacterium]MDZ7394028.1 zinc ribbon domain-containing protein [candidate division KSB1 bacterium]